MLLLSPSRPAPGSARHASCFRHILARMRRIASSRVRSIAGSVTHIKAFILYADIRGFTDFAENTTGGSGPAPERLFRLHGRADQGGWW